MKTRTHKLLQAGHRNQPRWIILAALFFLAALPIWGQIDRGTIQGLVKDPSGAVVPGAKVHIVRIETGSVVELTTDGAGLYTAPNLPAAIYRVEVEKPGFEKFVRQPVEVRPRVESTIDVALQTGSVNETVNVTSDAPVLDTAAV